MKKLLLVGLFILTLLFTAACTQPTPTKAPTPAPSNGAEQDAELQYFKAGDTYRLYQWFQPAGTEAYMETDIVSQHRREVINKLEAEHGIKYEFIPLIGSDYFGPVLNSVYSGTPMADGMHAGGPSNTLEDYYYQGIPGSVIAPISDYNIDFSDPAYFQQQVQQEFGTFNGKLYYFVMELPGIKSVEAAQVLFFNYRLIENTGYSVEDIYNWNKSGEWTWDRFLDVAVRATDKDTGIYGFGRSGALRNLIHSNNGDIVAPAVVEGETVDRYAANQPNTVSAYEFYKRLYDEGAMAPLDTAMYDQQAVDAFTGGQIAFMFNYFNRVMYNFGTKMDDIPFGYAMIPKGPAASDYVSDLSWFEPFCIFVGIDNANGTLKAMKELYRPMTGKGTAEDESLYETEIANYVEDANAKDIISMVRTKTVYKKNEIYPVVYGAISNADKENPVLTGEVTISGYLESIVEPMNAEIDKINRRD